VRSTELAVNADSFEGSPSLRACEARDTPNLVVDCERPSDWQRYPPGCNPQPGLSRSPSLIFLLGTSGVRRTSGPAWWWGEQQPW